MVEPIQFPVPFHLAPNAQERAAIAVLLTKIDEAIAFAEAVQSGDIAFMDTDKIADHLASLDVAQIKIGGGQ